MKVLRLVAAMLVAVSVLAPGASDVAVAQTTETGLCDTALVSQFTDVTADAYGAAYILCMRALGLSVGTGTGTYGPDSELTRGQMASFLARLWRDVLDRRCPSDTEAPFVDIVGNAHEANIVCLYGLEVAYGTTAVTYGPGEKLKVSQISRFLLRTYEKAGGQCEAEGPELDRALECLVGQNVIPSRAEGADDGSVTRAQMAVYMVGLWHNMADRGLPPAPPVKRVDGTYTAVSAGSYLSCGLLTDGTIECWGSNEHDQLSVAGGQFTTVSTGGEHACGLRPGGSISCWGNNEWGQVSVPDGRFIAVSVGEEHSCGLLTDGTIDCWGNNRHGQVTPPGGRFSLISAGEFHSCAIRTDGTAECWGYNEAGQRKEPDGQFTAVSAGGEHSCGLRSGGAVECWGSDRYGQLSPPGGTFVAVSAGWGHSCGLRSDGGVECWGRNRFGEANAPNGRFTAVSAGRFHTCGLQTDTSVRCWGNNRYGEINTPRG